MTSLWTVMAADHDLIWDHLNRLTGGPGYPQGEPGANHLTAKNLVAVASSHEAAEELIVWPAVPRP